jgi:signal peptidase II
MKPRALGVAAAIAALALDQASKLVVIYGMAMEGREPIVLAPFLNLALRWNRGISFSLFQQDTPLGRLTLMGFTLAATIFLCFWLWRTHDRLAAFALGAIIGGALGNGLDRFIYGAVADFLDLHAFGRNFFVFNIADAAINLGVGLLLLEVLFGGRARSRHRLRA